MSHCCVRRQPRANGDGSNNVRFNLQKHFEAGGADAVREELIRQRDSRLANRLNAWHSAFYEALAGSEWFYSGGFALG